MGCGQVLAEPHTRLRACARVQGFSGVPFCEIVIEFVTRLRGVPKSAHDSIGPDLGFNAFLGGLFIKALEQ